MRKIPGRKDRISQYAVDHDFETLLNKINIALSDIEKTLIAHNLIQAQPILFICYAPRTGSTLVAQSLARQNVFSYVSNFSARFWKAPTVGLMLEKKLDIRSCSSAAVWESKYGVTSSITDPHEFGFFWSQILSNSSTSRSVDQRGENLDILRRQILSMTEVFGKPFLFKSAIAGYNVDLMQAMFPDAYFLHIIRDPVFTAQSILIGRQNIFGNVHSWWSLIPENIDWILEQSLDEYDEVLLQVGQINKDIRRSFLDTGARHTTWIYEEFCADPRGHINNLLDWMKIECGDAVLELLPMEFSVSCKKHPIHYDRLCEAQARVACLLEND